MTQDEIIEMAIDAELNLYIHDLTEKQYIEVIKHFAKLVDAKATAKEREACAKVCDAYRDEWLTGLGRYEFMGEGADYLADFIRARGEPTSRGEA